MKSTIRKRSQIVLAALLASGFISGCGSAADSTPLSGPSEGGSQGTAKTEASPVRAPSGSTSAQGDGRTKTPSLSDFRRTWTYEYEVDSGYKIKGELKVGNVIRATPGMRLGQLTLGSACQIPWEGLAVIPAQFTETNLTPGFSARLAERFQVDFHWPAGWIAETITPSGPQCVGHPGPTFDSARKLEPGESATFDIFFLVAYYNPAHPNGDPKVLKSAYVTIGAAGTAVSQLTHPVKFTGPGVQRNADSDATVYLTKQS